MLRQGLGDAPAAGHGPRRTGVAAPPDMTAPDVVPTDEVPPEIAAAVRDAMAAWTDDTIPANDPPAAASLAPAGGP